MEGSKGEVYDIVDKHECMSIFDGTNSEYSWNIQGGECKVPSYEMVIFC